MDRRKNARYRVKETTFVKFSDNPIKVGQIMDISEGGLSFRYIADEKGSEELFEFFEIKLYFVGNGFSIEQLPAKTIYNFLLVSEFAYSVIKMRRVGIQFLAMTDQQKNQLEKFIHKYSIGEA